MISHGLQSSRNEGVASETVGLDPPCGAGRGAGVLVNLWGRFGRGRSALSHQFERSGTSPAAGGHQKEGIRMDAHFLVPVVGLEPTRCRHQRILSPSRLPFHHTGVVLLSIYQAPENSKRKRIMTRQRAKNHGRQEPRGSRKTVRTAAARRHVRGRSDLSRRSPRETAVGRKARPTRRGRRQE